MKLLTWPNVAIAAIGMAGFVGVFYLADQNGRTALIAVVTGFGSAITTIMVNRRAKEVKQEVADVRQEIEKVKEHVNGNTRILLDKIPDAERPALEDIPRIS